MKNGEGFDDNLDFSGIWSGGKTPDLNGPVQDCFFVVVQRMKC